MVACAIYSDKHFAANLILVQMISYPFAIFQGVSTAVSISIGNALGLLCGENDSRSLYRLMLTWLFLDASSHLYKRVCPSVGPSVTLLEKTHEIDNFMCSNDQEGVLSHE